MALVVFLRGFNFGGHRTVRPAMPAKELQHHDAANIGAAGTFVIQQPVSRLQLRPELRRILPSDAEIMICQGTEIHRLLSRNVFAGQPVLPEIVRFVSILSRLPLAEPPLPLILPSGDEWLSQVLARQGRFVIGLYRRHMKVIGYLGKLDRMFGARTTTRDGNTVIAIAKVLDSAAA